MSFPRGGSTHPPRSGTCILGLSDCTEMYRGMHAARGPSWARFTCAPCAVTLHGAATYLPRGPARVWDPRQELVPAGRGATSSRRYAKGTRFRRQVDLQFCVAALVLPHGEVS